MSFASSRRSIMYSSSLVALVVFLIFMLQIWVCSDCKAGAIRIFPDNGMPSKLKHRNITTTDNKATKQDLLRKFFNGRASSFNSSKKGFEENKRRVPSCPDPLHN
ncbi:CLAVATA3/ESR (CLE)-related protein 27 [Manihot esculenta]|uniref:Uncharacterized protein n=1 Tax=Manihot esculenta TaxID=3983 RepID=A0A2C9VNI0_MANES|nr:CLAVATA3/ESR (CLE)-related protein 27 [Manihot esculenta]OAY47304.1 hypothetical protein MANES_06G068400v8 [Manihot esculenta]